jgi:hypothetical protein
MKKIAHQPGGRLYKGEDFLTMQQLTLNLTEKLYAQYGNIILYGCEMESNGTLSDWSISPGVIMIDGDACAFPGAENARIPFHVEKVAITENVPYKTGEGAGYTVHIAQACSAKPGSVRLGTALRLEEVFRQDSYSYDEIRTNQRWVDGKSIYKKTVHLTFPGSKPHDIQNLAHVVKLEGMYHIPLSDLFVPLPDPASPILYREGHEIASVHNKRVVCNRTHVTVEDMLLYVDGNNANYYVTIYYTKN